MSIASNFPAIKPTLLLDFANTEQLDPRITFTRASTATYYGTQTAKAEENLLVQSQTFDNASWTKSNTAVSGTDTIVAPDGTTTAEEVRDGTATNIHSAFQGVTLASGTTYVASVFLKNVDRQYAILAVSGSVSAYASAKFDLIGGTSTANQAGGAGWSVTSVAMTPVGSDWYRCVLVFVSGTSGSCNVRIGLASDGTTFTTNGSGLESYTGTDLKIAVWGAQLEQRDAVTAYTPTTTQPITNYIPVLETAASGVARFDHNPTTGESLGLLIEESRTNLLTYSEQFDNAAWTQVNNNITANIITAPDGTLTGDQFVETTASGTHRARSGAITVSASTSYTFTVYAKATATGAQRFLALTLSSTTDITTGARRTVVFDLSNGSSTTAGGATFTLVGYGASSVGNGWYRCYTTVTTDAAGTTVYATSSLADSFSVNAISYTGDGTSGIYIWGAQLEAGAFATSYIPTVASQVTRAADAASMTGTNFSSWYNQAEGSLYAEASRFGAITFQAIANISDGSFANQLTNFYASAGAYRFDVAVGNVNQAAITGATIAGLNIAVKSASVYKFNDFGISVNGGAVVTDTAGQIPVVNKLSIGSSSIGANCLNGTIRKIAYYSLRVTNAQLQALTS